jgi:hypothetical protein
MAVPGTSTLVLTVACVTVGIATAFNGLIN